ncbi:hypothetical protein WJX74_008498 [Apatococcus lobatus]|uniref:Glutaredoxin domain-containing protein n=1 Tax=Apatococcus lobatus TaxID=904363 RepID=A0AAW1RPW2_9CHLO
MTVASAVGRLLLTPAGRQPCAIKHVRCQLGLQRPSFASRLNQHSLRRSCGALRTAGVRTFASASDDLVKQIKEKNDQNPVLIYSKSYCPYCAQVRGLFGKIEVDYKAINLDEVQEGDQILDGLMSITERKTVPQVFIKSEFIGGCDDTVGMLDSGELKKKLETAGISSNL